MAGHTTGILATGSYLPGEEIANEDLAERAGVDAEWILRKTQIGSAVAPRRTRRPRTSPYRPAWTRCGAPTSTWHRIGYIIVATSTGDFPQPPTSYLVQDALGARSAACFDINIVCSGFVYGLAIADSLIARRPDTYALVIGADLYSRQLDFTDRRTSVLFGDGSGVAIVGAVPEPSGFIDFELSSHGADHRLIGIKAGGSRHPASPQTVADGEHYFRMDGRGVTEFVLEHVPPAMKSLVDRAGFGLDEIDTFVPHQAQRPPADGAGRALRPHRLAHPAHTREVRQHGQRLRGRRAR